MTLKEKITQVIVDLNKESIKYPRMKTNDVTFMLAKLINDYHESDNNGWIKIEEKENTKRNDSFDIVFTDKRNVYTYATYCNFSSIYEIEKITHFQQITKPQDPVY